MKCIYPKHGAFYLVKKGKWTRLGKTMEEALENYAKLQSPEGSMAGLIDRVLAYKKPRLSKNTIRQYEIAANVLKRKLAEFRPEQVKPKHVAGIKVSMSDTPNMANRCLSLLRAVFAVALEWQLVETNPCLGIDHFTEDKRERLLSDSELAAIYAHSGPRLQVIIELLYGTAQRVGDVLQIRHSDLTQEGMVFVQEKTGSRLLIRWNGQLRASVDKARALYGNILALTLLHTRRGKPPAYKTIYDQWTRACEKAGITDANLHDIRAKALTDAKKQGKDPTLLAGHADPNTTKTYLRAKEIPSVDGLEWCLRNTG